MPVGQEIHVCRRFEYMAADLTLELAMVFENDVKVCHTVKGTYGKNRPKVTCPHLEREDKFFGVDGFRDAVLEFNSRVKTLL